MRKYLVVLFIFMFISPIYYNILTYDLGIIDINKDLPQIKQFNKDIGYLSRLADQRRGKLHYNVTVSRSDIGKDNMRVDLRQPSGYSVVLFESALEGTAMEGLGKYFYNAEKEYNINGIFLMAVAVHESGWGTSSFARNRNNLTGYMAYTNDPNKAHRFKSKESNIMETGRMLSRAYLTDGGKFFSGGYTLTHVYKKYAAPQSEWNKRWDVIVAKTMSNLEKRIVERSS